VTDHARRWRRLEEPLVHEPALEVRAEHDADGGWTIRSERAVGTAPGTLVLGFLHLTVQDDVVEVC
jgi:hypothetical protein